MKFTHRSLTALKPRDSIYEMPEDNGHGLRIRVNKSGTKSFIYRYKYNGKSRGMTLGQYGTQPGETTLAQAHLLHAEARAQLKQGIDPGAKKINRIRQERAAETVGDLADLYLERHAKKNKKSGAEDERMLEKDVLPYWKERKAKDIRRKDVIALLDNIVDRGAPIAANRTFEIIRKMFNFGIERGIIEHTPCHMVKAPGKKNQRSRVLTPDEIRRFWRGMYRADQISHLVKLALKLQLVTAQRKGEVIAARWADLDTKNRWWIIPDTKNRLPHRVPLSDLAIAIIKHIGRISGESEWLFPNPSNTDHITERAPTRAVSRNLNNWEIDHFTPHDLRRTAASHMASIGIPRLVIAKILNHVDTGITAVYDRHGYDTEKQEALDLWSDKLWDFLTKVN